MLQLSCVYSYRCKAEHGARSCCPALSIRCPQEQDNAYAFAARNGDLRTLGVLRQLGCPWSNKTFSWACCFASLPVLRWMVAEGCPVDIADALDMARQTRACGVLPWLHIMADQQEQEERDWSRRG